MNSLATLKERLNEVSRLGQAAAVLDWDQQCYMPAGAGEARAEQSAVLQRVIHEKFTSDEVGKLLDEAKKDLNGASNDDDNAAMIRVAKMDFDREIKVPGDLVAEQAKTTSLAHEVWVKARKENDFASFEPWLEKIVDICRRVAEYRGYKEHIYDALIEPFEPGMQTSEVERIFDALRPELVKLVQEIKGSSAKVDASIMTREFPEELQQQICNDLVQRIGFDFKHGRQDKAAHPFCTSFSPSDVRITTRFDEHYLPGSLFASMHEAGHGLYEQGSPAKYDGTPLAGGTSLGFHESQSRMWENQIGRSRAFIEFYFPVLQEKFASLRDVSAEEFYKAANNVSPSLIRVEADEVTYGLHIMLRFELEKLMVEGKVRFSDLPELWNTKMQEYLGVKPSSDSEGVLQDVHWSAGIIGYFPTYQLGNLISAQLWAKMQQDIPDIYRQIGRGQFSDILQWLRTNVHQHGRKYLPGELIVKVTGQPIEAKTYMQYLRGKYSDIYQL